MRGRTIATIDLGTNSIHLLIIEKKPDDTLQVLHDSSEVVRMGQSLRETGNIHPDAVTRTQKVLQKYKQELQRFSCDEIYMTATSAMREAHNRAEVLDQLHQDLGFTIEIIAKEEEARLSYLSIVADMPHDQPPKTNLVADIGGGSTEIAWGQGLCFTGGQSVPIGTVKLLEGPLAKPCITPEDVQKATDEIHAYFDAFALPTHIDRCYGTAGSFTQLACIEKQLASHTPQSIDQFALRKNRVSQWVTRLAEMPLSQQQNIIGMHPNRVDVALAGTVIAYCLFRLIKTDTFIIRDRGVRYGKAFDILGSDVKSLA